MQLKPKTPAVRRRLIAASCALLGTSAARSEAITDAGAESTSPDWVVDTALAYYHESDGRITAIEPIINLRKDSGDGNVLSVDLTFDSLSGSTPNGALPSRTAQTFASPSGKSLSAAAQTYTTASGQISMLSAPIYTVGPGQLPMDPHYHDQRLAVGGSWEQPLSRLTRTSVGGKLSYEHDFISLSVNGLIARDFNEKNTTLSAGFNGEFDAVRPIGGAPVPGSDYALFEKTGNKGKNGVGLQFGATQVMTRRWLSVFNVSVDRFNGYLNDPYKIISLVASNGDTAGYLYEKRPDTRTRNSAYLENRLAWNRASVALSMRYMGDDWGIRSSTAQLHLRWWNPDRDRYLQPTFRWYRQTAANFYTPWISSASNQYVSYASSDARLGAFHALTYGLKYAAKLQDAGTTFGSELSVRLEFYRQTPDTGLPGPGSLQGLSLYPGLKAVMMQVGWQF